MTPWDGGGRHVEEDPPPPPDNVFELFLALAIGGLVFIVLMIGLNLWGP